MEKKYPEDYVVSHDLAIGESSTVVTTIPTKGNDFDKDKKDMEKINIAKKLKYCKKGTKLYSPLFGEVEFDDASKNIIYVTNIDADGVRRQSSFNEYGEFIYNYPDAECLLFPSKDNKDWSSFQVLEEGHRVMCSNNAQNWSLRKYYKNNYVYPFSENKDASNTWSYIVPVEDFDFLVEDITINKEKSIV